MFMSAGFNLSLTPLHVQRLVTAPVLNMSINVKFRMEKKKKKTTQKVQAGIQLGVGGTSHSPASALTFVFICEGRNHT